MQMKHVSGSKPRNSLKITPLPLTTTVLEKRISPQPQDTNQKSVPATSTILSQYNQSCSMVLHVTLRAIGDPPLWPSTCLLLPRDKQVSKDALRCWTLAKTPLTDFRITYNSCWVDRKNIFQPRVPKGRRILDPLMHKARAITTSGLQTSPPEDLQSRRDKISLELLRA